MMKNFTKNDPIQNKELKKHEHGLVYVKAAWNTDIKIEIVICKSEQEADMAPSDKCALFFLHEFLC